MIKIMSVLLSGCLLLVTCTGQAGVYEKATSKTQEINFAELTKLLESERQVNSIIVSQNNNIIYEFYLAKNEKDRVYNFNSVAKSITSLIAGIAIDTEYIKNEEVYISDYFPDIQRDSTLKKSIQLKHLLSMTSGISWPESTTWNHFFRPMIESNNWISFILEREMSEQPGKVFNYNSGGHHLVSKIIQDTTHQNMFNFGKTHLFNKLNMESVSWYDDPQGVCFGGAWIRMSAKEALKIGQLILDNGYYNNQQIISSEWINKMTSTQSSGYKWDDYIGGEYGYGWWINSYYDNKTFFAWGANEQYIFVTPSLNLAAVFNSTFNNQKATRPPYIYAEYIIKELITKKGA